MRGQARPALWFVALAVCALSATAGQAKPRRLPPGSYQATCVNAVFSNAGLLMAQCKDASGRLVAAQLKMPECGKGDIANTGGRLTCPPLFTPKKKPPSHTVLAPPKAGPLPPASLTFYDGVDYKGRSLEITKDVPDLVADNFNDLPSSVRVHGGQWQVCVDTFYRGKCTLLDKDSPNLTRFGMNNRISSIRRTG